MHAPGNAELADMIGSYMPDISRRQAELALEEDPRVAAAALALWDLASQPDPDAGPSAAALFGYRLQTLAVLVLQASDAPMLRIARVSALAAQHQCELARHLHTQLGQDAVDVDH